METVTKAIKKLMIKEPFYGIFASGLSRSWSTQVDHMGIVLDGLNYKLLINKKYWYSLDFEHQLGLLQHNLLHMCFFHVTDSNLFLDQAKNHTIMQVAMDMEVNSYIYDEWIPNDLSTKIFKTLPNLPKRKGTKYYIDVLNNIDCGLSCDSEGRTWGVNTDSIREELQHEHTDHNTWTSGMVGQNISLYRTQLEYQLKTVSTALSKDKIPRELRNIIDGLLTFKKPIFNWKKFFRNFMANAFDSYPKSTRRKESTRFAGALGHKLSKKHTILVGVDTSGSIGQKELDEFFSEIYHVWKAGANVDIVEFDTIIQQEYHYKGKTPKEVKGRGGTNFAPFVTYFNLNKNKYSLGICFTDGYASLDDINPFGKFCWVITSNGDKEKKYPGYKICIPKIIE